MTTTRLVLAALTLLFVVPTPAAAQGLPDNRNISLDAVIVGNASGHAIGGTPAGFDAVIRDVFMVPIAGRPLFLDFSATGIRLLATQSAGTTLNCAAKSLSRLTNAAGAVNFAARFGSFDNTNSVEVMMDGVVLGLVKARSTDLDGLDGKTGLGDFAHFSNNFLNATAAQESDFDLNGTTGLGDFVIFSGEFLSNTTGAYCP